MITFAEREPDAPEAVRAWFYPGESYGHDFVYPKVKAVALAKANNQPVPSMPNELAPNTTQPTESMAEPRVVAMKETPLKAQQASEVELDIADVFAAAIPVPPLPETLPATASLMPLLACVGLLSLCVAASLRLAFAKMN